MPSLDELVAYANQRTRLDAYQDAPGARNGLQVANNGAVTKIGAAVDSGLVPFQRAVAAGVDFLIVHHGMYWDMPQLLTGPVYTRVKTLFDGNCALYSNHLPLDGHPEIGNNALLAKQLGLTPDRPFMETEGGAVGCSAPWSGSRDDLKTQLEAQYDRVVPITCGSTTPSRIAFCSGSGNSAMKELVKAGIDTLVTGELREEWFNFAQERGLNVFLCGHYATEVHAVQALAAELAAKFDLPWEFIRTENPL
ncbi:Nif3-like dinuclear metal center hexameric protein [Actomonas aquatica]|uniref:Nif3-like dinuclear metal center hexameric protein n=1 Tax=Actomonas aquatica TaxID=2866162 RepID=A0ABZ1CEE4_9BACT|nr:Nif3-like dinuclear metal center hexameric protein [Opitutus sp. WL0086]WRQ88989.1 Nif3-like dinuclear metal center hexameric protein [Opitutus sp. WL0086]